MSKSCRRRERRMDKRASRRHNPAEVRTGRIGAGTGIFTGRNRHRNRERVRFRHNCPNPPFGRETHVDGAWLGPGAFGRATRDLFPRSNDTGRESIGMAPRVRLGRRADNAQDGSQCPVSTSSGHWAMTGGDFAVAASGPTRFALEKDRSPPEVGRPWAQVPTLLERD